MVVCNFSYCALDIFFYIDFFLLFLFFTISSCCVCCVAHLYYTLFMSHTFGTLGTNSNETSIDRRPSNSRLGKEVEVDSGTGSSAFEKRFAYSLLEKLLEYFDNASTNMTQTRPSSRYSRRESFATATEDVKFFGKVIIFLLYKEKGVY